MKKWIAMCILCCSGDRDGFNERMHRCGVGRRGNGCTNNTTSDYDCTRNSDPDTNSSTSDKTHSQRYSDNNKDTNDSTNNKTHNQPHSDNNEDNRNCSTLGYR